MATYDFTRPIGIYSGSGDAGSSSDALNLSPASKRDSMDAGVGAGAEAGAGA